MATNVNPASHAAPTRLALWAGRVLSGLVALALTASVAMKFVGGAAGEEMMAHLGIPAGLGRALPFIELACLALYLIPRTAPLGAILLAGYMGGAVFAHLRVGEAVVVQVTLGVLAWAGLVLRDARLAAYLRETIAGR